MSPKELVAYSIWAVGVIAVAKFAHDVLAITGAELAVIVVVLFFGSFYAVFMPVWRRVPDTRAE